MKNKRYLVIAGLLALGALSIAAGTNFLRQPAPQESIVKVLNPNNPENGGTGFIVKTKRGRKVIVTNEHVCAANSANTMVIQTLSGGSYIKNILKVNAQRDLCVIEGIDAPALSLSDINPIPYNALTVYGNPFLNPTQPSKGVFVGNTLINLLKAPNENGECSEGTQPLRNWLFLACVAQYELSMTTVAIFPGSSGSPVLNESGQVVGVMNASDRTSHYGYFIPLQYLKQILGFNE